MKKAEWQMEKRWNGRKDVEHHTSGPWDIVIDPDTRDGFIKSKHRKTIVEPLEPNRFLAKGTGIPDYVIDKVNEVIVFPQPVVEGGTGNIAGIKSAEYDAFIQAGSTPMGFEKKDSE